MKTKMNKRALIAAATLATSLVLVACGNDSKNEDTATPMESSSEMMQSSSEQMDTSSMMESDSSSMSSTQSSSESSDMTNDSTEGIETKEFDTSMEQAVDKFKETFPDAKITAIDKDSNNYVYEIEGFNDKNEVEISVDAMTGKIVKQDTDDRDDVIDDDVLELDGIITPQEAMKKALDKVGSGYAKEWELDSKDGKVYYEVDVEGSDKDNDDVHIDANTGDFIGFD